MNPAFTSTAAVADIRRAIAFATETSRPPAKARAYASSSEPHEHTCSHNTSKADSDLDEEYECFIQDRQYFEGKKAAKAIEGEKRCFVCKKPGCWSTNHTPDERKASVAKFQSSKDAKRVTKSKFSYVGLVERYHVLVRRAFEIVIKELPKAPREDRLQMAIKAINDTAGLNGLVPTLFVFGTLPRLTEQDRPAASTQERAAAINKAIREKYDPSIPTVPDEEEDDSYVLFTKDSEVFVTDKERRDHELSAKLRAEGIIKSPGAPFQESKAKELARLIAQGILQVIPSTDPRAKGARIFGSRFVDEIKGKGIPTLYEKSRIVV
ncbi:hypothetical protein MBM_04188 [Drepanopeziza brunnea f. sp. 'multigermtubi' MB_m1]|uniref:Uncharacterized protein n=1 Tax=Marssonina brunnea f. sp. multigermtubi (strain MB_m1) TaxID=1072389 RepID=K1XYC1_MARBU|nr:uncharacterized protein MBM_04188 [Drepanopeziza brunnea f. sp. 'multigermtubi' MB_m1]EKD17819.1 hypothetical protein MBM_04188 [Drepanopeziza brunnea f. sp. 'multigermtubi' MB_m1]